MGVAGWKAGDDCHVWWWTGRKGPNGWNVASVLAVEPYRGRYPEFFKATLTLYAPRTMEGKLQMPVGAKGEEP